MIYYKKRQTLTKYIVFLLVPICISFCCILNVSAYYQFNKTSTVSFTTATYQNLAISTDKTTYGLCNKSATILLTVGNLNNYNVEYTITFSNSSLAYTIDGAAVFSYTLLSGESKTHTIVVSGTTSTTELTINVVSSSPYATIHNKEVTLDLICPQCTWGGGQFTNQYLKNGSVSTYTIDCTDAYGITSGDLTSSSFGVSNSSLASVSSVTKATITNGYRYTVSVIGKTGDGNVTLSLNANVLKDNNANWNVVVTGGTITVDNIRPTMIITGQTMVSTNGLLRYYDAYNNNENGHTTGTTWKDLSNHYDATINGATVNGRYTSFDGVDDYVVLGEFNDLTAASLEATAMVNSYGTTTTTYLISNVENGGMGLAVVNGVPRVTVYTNGAYTTLALTEKIELGVTHTYTGTYDGTTLKLYIDGILHGSKALTGAIGNPLNSTLLIMGCNASGSGCNDNSYLPMNMYAARAYNRAITEAEIKQNMNADNISAQYSTNDSTATLSFISSEAITGFITDDITITNATKGTFSTISSSHYTLGVTAIANSANLTANVNSASFTDIAGNSNENAITLSRYHDVGGPSATITHTATVSNNVATVTYQIVFHEAAFGFLTGDIVLNDGTKGTFTKVDNKTYTLVVTYTTSGTKTLSFAAGAAYDRTGNASAARSYNVVVDVTPPSVYSITYDPGWKNTSVYKEVYFKDNLSGINRLEYSYDQNTWYSDWDGTVTLNGISGNKKTWSGDQNRVLWFRAIDNAGNIYMYPPSYDLKIDTKHPTMIITGQTMVSTNGLLRYYDAYNNNGNGHTTGTTWKDLSNHYDATINGATVNGRYTSFDGVDDYVVLGEFNDLTAASLEATAMVNSYGTSTTYLISNVENGGMGLAVVNGVPRVTVYTNGAYTTLALTEKIELGVIHTYTGTYDGATLKLYIDGILQGSKALTGAIGNPINSTLLIMGCNAGGSGCNDNSYLPMNMYAARAYNRAITPAEIKQNMNADNISTQYPTNDSTATLSFISSEAITGFTTDDITITNATKGTFSTISSSHYTLGVTAIANSANLTANVNSASFIDVAGNSNENAITLSRYHDVSGPSATITHTATVSNNVATVTYQIVFHEAVFGFLTGDIVLNDGTKGTFTKVDNKTYTLVVTYTTSGTKTLSFAAGAAYDRTGNASAARSYNVVAVNGTQYSYRTRTNTGYTAWTIQSNGPACTCSPSSSNTKRVTCGVHDTDWCYNNCGLWGCSTQKVETRSATYSAWGEWSAWQTTAVTANDITDVRTQPGLLIQ